MEAFENSSGKQLCGIDVKDLYERCMEGSSMESISYSVQDEIEKLKTVGMLEGEMTPDSYQKSENTFCKTAKQESAFA